MAATVEQLHCALCGALGIPAWKLGPSDYTTWQGFLFVMKTLDETEGGPLTPRDVINVVNLMRKQQREGVPWSLRHGKILRDPETFRDLVFETRRPVRPRPAVQTESRSTPGGNVMVETDPAAASDPQEIAAAVKREAARFRETMGLRRGDAHQGPAFSNADSTNSRPRSGR